MYGPKGIGALYVRRGSPRIRMDALLDGGGHERRLRSGTLPVPLILGFGKASELCYKEFAEEERRLGELRNRLWHVLAERVEGVIFNGAIPLRGWQEMRISAFPA